MTDDLVSGNELLAQTLTEIGVDTCYFLMGGPTVDAANAMEDSGIRMIATRHEQAAVMAAHADARLRRRPAMAMACSGPGTTNQVTGVANAYVGGAPVVVLGGSGAIREWGQGGFQELDQVAVMKPITRWAVRVHDARRIPEVIGQAFIRAWGPRPGPVYVDLPGDVLYTSVPRAEVRPSPFVPGGLPAPQADPAAVARAADIIAESRRPVLICGNGAIWSDAAELLEEWLTTTDIPVFTTPEARGVIAEDHKKMCVESRSKAFAGADVVIVLGTRLNYVVSHLAPPRFDRDVKVIQIDIDPAEIGSSRPVDLPLIGDCRAILGQLLDELRTRSVEDRFTPWLDDLRSAAEAKRVATASVAEMVASSTEPIHPRDLCRVLADFLDRDAILCADGQEILNYARQVIPVYVAAHSLNSGPFGTMGVGLPFGVGAQVACPDQQVVVLHGDGSFGLNAMEVDTAVRYQLPILTVISNNGGWTATDKYKAGRALQYSRYDQMAEALGCHGEHVERLADLRPALERAAVSGRPAVVNVVTDSAARASTAKFTSFET